MEYVLLVYVVGFLISLFLGPSIAPINENTGDPIMSVTYVMVAAAWPIMICYLAVAVLFGDDDDNEVG